MMMEGIASRSELRKELERERRRLRDRERRQSMSHEEREKHLARRRRNYQLRRQRAETARLYTPPPHIKFEETTRISTIHSPLTLSNSVSSLSPQFNAASVVDPNHGRDRLLLDTRSSQSLEIPAHKLAILPGKVRLNRIKHLARVINDPGCNEVAMGGIMKENGTSNCIVSKRLRLSRIKRIARSVNSIVQETPYQSITEGLRTKGYSQRPGSITDVDELMSKGEGCLEFSSVMMRRDVYLLGLDFDMPRGGLLLRLRPKGCE